MRTFTRTKDHCDIENCCGQVVADRLCERHWWEMEQTMTDPLPIPDAIKEAYRVPRPAETDLFQLRLGA